MNLLSWLLLVMLAVWLVGALAYIIRHRGGCSCGGSAACESCTRCESCAAANANSGGMRQAAAAAHHMEDSGKQRAGGREAAEAAGPDCPCKRTGCERHGDCTACKAHHRTSGRRIPTACARAGGKNGKERQRS